MAYIKLTTNEYPRHEGDIRLEHPETPTIFECPPTYAPVAYIDPPAFDEETQVAYELPPEQDANGWHMVWAVRDLTPEEIAIREEFINQQTPPM